VTLKPQSQDERKTTNCNSENLVVLRIGPSAEIFFLPPAPEFGPSAEIFFLPPAPELDSDFRLSNGVFTKLEYLILNHHWFMRSECE
jgi:hypothetical protein